MAELADALDLGSSGRPCGFESHFAHHYLLSGSEVKTFVPEFFIFAELFVAIATLCFRIWIILYLKGRYESSGKKYKLIVYLADFNYYFYNLISM